MANFLTICLVLTYFLGGAVSVTDKEFKDMSRRVDRLTEMFEDQFLINRELKEENAVLKEEIRSIKKQLGTGHVGIRPEVLDEVSQIQEESIQNTTIEERVALLEIQVVVIQDEVTDLETDVDFLFEEQIIQDERLLGLENRVLDAENEVEDLTATTVSLDFRVTVLEENGGGNGNSSVAELEVRVETLEGTAADHETRISATENDVTDLDVTVADHETRLTAAEENIQGTIAFHTVLTSYSSIPDETPILFNVVLLNEGEGYDSTTGTFTVPSGGDGFYYFSVYLAIEGDAAVVFDVEVNGELLCSANSDLTESPASDRDSASCSGTTYASDGDTVQVVYKAGYGTEPLFDTTTYYYHGFTGFRI